MLLIILRVLLNASLMYDQVWQSLSSIMPNLAKCSSIDWSICCFLIFKGLEFTLIQIFVFEFKQLIIGLNLQNVIVSLQQHFTVINLHFILFTNPEMSHQYSLRQLKTRERRFKSYFAPDEQKMEIYDPFKDPTLNRYFKLPIVKHNLELVGLLKRKKKRAKNRSLDVDKNQDKNKGKSLSKVTPEGSSLLPSIHSSIRVSIDLNNRKTDLKLRSQKSRVTRQSEKRNFSQLSINYTT